MPVRDGKDSVKLKMQSKNGWFYCRAHACKVILFLWWYSSSVFSLCCCQLTVYTLCSSQAKWLMASLCSSISFGHFSQEPGEKKRLNSCKVFCTGLLHTVSTMGGTDTAMPTWARPITRSDHDPWSYRWKNASCVCPFLDSLTYLHWGGRR